MQNIIGDLLREQRLTKLKRGLREAAGILGVSPAYVTDLEKGHRTPSEELMVRIAELYQVPLAELRAGWDRPDSIVRQVAGQSAVTAEKVPQLLRAAQALDEGQWNQLIAFAQKLAAGKRTVRRR